MKSDMKADYTVAVLGDLHLDPRKMDDYEVGREHVKALLEEERENGAITTLVSLGDLGESKSVRPEETQELFAGVYALLHISPNSATPSFPSFGAPTFRSHLSEAIFPKPSFRSHPSSLLPGTSECHQLAHDFLSSFECKPNDHGALYEVVGGNHDLEGIDEFATDQANLEAYLRLHGKPTPQFSRQIGEKTLLLGLGSSVFRTAVHTSHEVTIDDAQLDWFERMLENHPASEGGKVFVFTHAPPMGSGLRVLQSNHVVNGCCWLNHSGPRVRDFIELVRTHRCIKAWFSGHFHLGQDYEDSITFPTADGSRGSCVFAQTSVMRSGTSRDSRQQSRLIRGNEEGFEVCTVNHAKGGELRLDASITYEDDGGVIAIAYDHEDFDHDDFDGVYIPSLDDGCRVQDASGTLTETECTLETTQWWEMTDGKVLGLHEGMLLEYDPSTLAPLGLVVGADELHGRQVAVVDSSIEVRRSPPFHPGPTCWPHLHPRLAYFKRAPHK